MNTINKWWHQFTFSFKLSLSLKLMQCCGDPVKVLTFHFEDKPVTVGVWRYNLLPTLLVGDASIPSAVVSKRPKNSTVGLEIGIFVNDAFLQLSDDAQYATCMHEFGHIVFNHTTDPKYTKTNGVLNDLIAEFEADVFAIDHGYGAPLCEVFTTMETNCLAMLEKDLPEHRFMRASLFEMVRQLQERRRVIMEILQTRKDANYPEMVVAVSSSK